MYDEKGFEEEEHSERLLSSSNRKLNIRVQNLIKEELSLLWAPPGLQSLARFCS